MIHFKIKEQIYRIPLAISVGNWIDYSELLPQKYNVESGKQIHLGGCCEWYKQENFALCSVWLPEFDYNNIYDIGSLSHEIDHAVMFIFDLLDIPILDKQSNHAYIYLKEYFLTKALKKLKGA